MANQQVPDGYYHLDQMITSAARHGAEVGCCGSCLDARGIRTVTAAIGAADGHTRTRDPRRPPRCQPPPPSYDRWFDAPMGRYAFAVKCAALRMTGSLQDAGHLRVGISNR